MTLMGQHFKNVYFYVGLKLQVCSLFCSCFRRIAHFVVKLWVRMLSDVRNAKRDNCVYMITSSEHNIRILT